LIILAGFGKVVKMPKVEKAIHLDAFKLYMEMGGMSPAFLGRFRTEFKRSRTTAYDWQKDFDWEARAKKPIDAAVEKLEEQQALDAEELIGGLLDLCRNRMDGLETQLDYIKGIFATAFDRIQSGDLKVESISDLKELVLAGSRLIRDEQGYMRLLLTLVGKPEQIMEDRMVVQFVGLPEGILDDDSSDGDADIPEAD
jgi:hypothetical protein